MNPTLAVVWLAVLNTVCWAAQAFLGARLLRLALWPFGQHVIEIGAGRQFIAGFQPYQLISYGFLHGDFMHLAMNLLGLLIFGPLVERCMGLGHFVFYYFFCLVSAGVAQLLVAAGDGGPPIPTIGASGAVYGLIAAAALLYPRRRLLLPFPPVEVEVRALAFILAGAAMLHGVFGTQAGTAHFAHLGGMLGGFVLVQYWRGLLPIKPRRWLEP